MGRVNDLVEKIEYYLHLNIMGKVSDRLTLDYISTEINHHTEKVFICSNYRGDVETNVDNALYWCKKATNQGYLPIAPHLYFPQFLDDDIPSERESGIAWGIDILNDCDELWICSKDISDGMKREIEYARTQGIPIINKVRS